MGTLKHFLRKILFAFVLTTTALFSTDSFADCPLFSQQWESGAVVEMPGGEYDFDGQNACIAARIYGQIGYHPEAMGEDLEQLAEYQNSFDPKNELNQDSLVNIAFCGYDENTGNYDLLCTPAIDICSEDLEGLASAMSSGNIQDSADMFDLMISYIEYKLNESIPHEYYLYLFTDNSDSIHLESFCSTGECPFGTYDDFPGDCAMWEWIACDAGEYLYVDSENEIAECRTCPSGSYCPEYGSYGVPNGTQGLYSCPAHSTSITGQTQCTCDNGYTWISSTNTCVRDNIITLYQNVDPNNDTVNATVYVATGSSMPTTNSSGQTLTAPTRNGYIFTGYYDARTGGTKYYNENMTSAHAWNSSSDGALYAQWIYMPVVTLYQNADPNNDTVNATVRVTTGSAMPTTNTSGQTLTAPTRSGYIFNGYWSARTGGTQYYKLNMTSAHTWDSNSDGSLYAQWIDESVFKFTLTTTSTNSFQFRLTATGTFYVDCGPGGTLSGTGVSGNTITKSNTNSNVYTCSWSSAGAHTIRFGGTATGYATGDSAAIRFYSDTNNDRTNVKKIASISGSLGQIFGTVTNPSTGSGQPRFYRTFYYASNMTGAIPANLFTGISGAPVSYMFYDTFNGCSGLTGSIPATLFSGISGAPAQGMFFGTFEGCSGLTGSIPATLFSGISGAPAQSMFNQTFYLCSGLTGSIPATLFSGISGAPVSYMFFDTFNGCSGLTGSIPSGLFGNISGAPADSMFYATFSGCSGLTGSIPATLFSGISGAPVQSMFVGTFKGCGGLTGSIPATLFSGISGAPASWMFSSTFYGCRGLSGSIPAGLFGNLSGAPASGMFNQTFFGCSGLSSYIPPTLFAGISTSSTASSQMSSVFSGSGLDTSCPNGTTQYNTGFESYFNGKVSCEYTSASVNLYQNASLIDNTINATISVDYGSAMPSIGTIDGNSVSLTAPTRSGFVFDGYYSARDGGTKYYNSDMTSAHVWDLNYGDNLYAHWTSICPEDHFIPEGHPNMCFPHVLHVGDNVVYLSDTKTTTPSLNVAYGNDVFYANMTTTQTYMSSGYEHYLKTIYNNEIYYICDDTSCSQ